MKQNTKEEESKDVHKYAKHTLHLVLSYELQAH